jgi:hypothetical protein
LVRIIAKSGSWDGAGFVKKDVKYVCQTDRRNERNHRLLKNDDPVGGKSGGGGAMAGSGHQFLASPFRERGGQEIRSWFFPITVAIADGIRCGVYASQYIVEWGDAEFLLLHDQL